jgi:phenylacetate-CoA ligase
LTESNSDQSVPWYGRSLNFEMLWRDFPPPPDYFSTVYRMSRSELRARQEVRFLQQVRRGWEVPFYRRHWSAVGLEPGDIRGLEDLEKIPPYTVDDIRKSIERNPPWGDYLGLDIERDPPMPLVIQTSGGTTGMPRPMMYAPQDREVMNILMGRRLHMQGVRAFDLVQIALSFGLSNGGIATREGVWKYTGAIPVMTGSGANTPTRRQIEILKAWKVSFLVGFPAYLRHMALIAQNELGLEPHSLGLKGLLVHLGVDSREALEELWGAAVYDCYGVHECGAVAADCSYRTGMHIFEDAFLLEIVDPDTQAPKADGERGTIFLTSLFRRLAPVIRYNVNDVSAFASGDCPCGATHRRLERVYGRSDNMVKLRGVNLFPEVIGEIISRDRRCNGEYVCLVETIGPAGRDEMTVLVEMVDKAADGALLAADLARGFRETVGVKIVVKTVGKGELDSLTGLSQTSKVKRVIDRRKPS